jgi:hypothetical protein
MIDPYSTSPLTKREQLISTALQGLLANPNVNNGSYDRLILDAINVADSLIATVNASEQVPVFVNNTVASGTPSETDRAVDDGRALVN